MSHRHLNVSSFQAARIASAAFVVLALLALAVAPAAAQEAKEPPAQSEAPTPPPAESFSDDELEAFVDVAIEVQQVVASVRQQIAAAESEEKTEELAQQGNQKITEVIEAHPEMTKEKYQQIALRARQDQEFKKQLDGMLLEAMQGRGHSMPGSQSGG